MPHRLEGPRRVGCEVLLVATLVCAGSVFAVPAEPPTGTDVPADRAPATDGSREPADGDPAPESLATALRMIREGRHLEAREFLEPVVARHPGSARALLFLALTYHKESHWEPARKLYAKVLELDPGFHECKVPYGWCLYYLGELDRAREMFEAYLSVRPDYLDAVFALGLIDFDDDDVESARSRFARAIELARAQGDTAREALSRFRMADVLVRSGDLEQAKVELLRSIGLDPSNHKCHFKLSRVLQQLGDDAGAARAREQYEKLVARDPPENDMR